MLDLHPMYFLLRQARLLTEQMVLQAQCPHTGAVIAQDLKSVPFLTIECLLQSRDTHTNNSTSTTLMSLSQEVLKLEPLHQLLH